MFQLQHVTATVVCVCGAVHSEWSEWSEWGACTVSCGTGRRRRFRSCLSPSSTTNARPCVGVGQQTDVCNQQLCAGQSVNDTQVNRVLRLIKHTVRLFLSRSWPSIFCRLFFGIEASTLYQIANLESAVLSCKRCRNYNWLAKRLLSTISQGYV